MCWVKSTRMSVCVLVYRCMSPPIHHMYSCLWFSGVAEGKPLVQKFQCTKCMCKMKSYPSICVFLVPLPKIDTSLYLSVKAVLELRHVVCCVWIFTSMWGSWNTIERLVLWSSLLCCWSDFAHDSDNKNNYILAILSSIHVFGPIMRVYLYPNLVC